MNKFYFIIILCFTCNICDAQNLVPNGDFEQYDGCSFSISMLDSAAFWFNPTNSSPDYFNQCSLGGAGIPYNYFGYQSANTGAGMGGFYIWSGGANNYREYIEVPLIAPLIANVCYRFSMWINLGNRVKYTSDDIGVYFSDTIVNNVSTYYELPFVPQIQNSQSIVPDSLNWTYILETFTANGGESYMIIGNFMNDSSTTLTNVNSLGPDSACYFYIDDICLAPCGASCTTGINEHSSENDVKIYPNPGSNVININYPAKGKLEVINTMGQTLISKAPDSGRNENVSLDISFLLPGIYIIRGTNFLSKFIKE